MLAAVAALVTLSACTPGPVPDQTTAQPPAGELIRVSESPGFEVDRLRLPASNAEPDGFADAPSGEGLTGYLDQRVDWRACSTFECTRVLVPLDYANPSEQAITLALARRKATKTPVLGTLFINPGGPGGSGRNMVTYFESEGLEQYDIVGWDPRGTNASTPVRCFDETKTDDYVELDASPDDAAETQALLVGTYEFAVSCWERSGDLLKHISTIDTVRDLDLLRQLLGDDKLNFLGYSYGTRVGSYYADLFPQRVGRLVLDASVDITGDDSVIQAMGFDQALDSFAAWCARQNCRLGSTKEAVLAATTGFLERLDGAPLRVPDTSGGSARTLTQTLAATGIAAYMYGGIPAWQVLERDLAAAALDSDGGRLLRASDGLNSRSEDGTYGSLFYSFQAIGCADSDDQGVLDAERRWTDDQRKAPVYGKYFGPGYTCALWPVNSAPQLKPTGSGAGPIVVVGATGDPATPYQHAVTMAQQLESAVLLTYEGEGHGTFGGKSECVDNAVIAYLTQGTVPAEGMRCR